MLESMTFLQKWGIKNLDILSQRYEENVILEVVELTKDCLNLGITTTPAKFLWYIIQRPLVKQKYKAIVEDKKQEQRAIRRKDKDEGSCTFNKLQGRCRKCPQYKKCLAKNKNMGKNAFHKAIESIRVKKEGE